MKKIIKLIVCCLFVSQATGFAQEVKPLNVTVRPLTVASYNIRCQNESDDVAGNGWKDRCPQICAIIRFQDWDILGAQEVKYDQLLDMCEQLKDYDVVSVGRDDGKNKGEASSIFYKRNRFTLLDKGSFWLSETPEKPSFGWGAKYIRICTWVKLTEKNGGRTLFFFNTHMDWGKPGFEGAKLIMQKINEITKDQPVIVTGDFNCAAGGDTYNVFAKSGVFRDSREHALIRLDHPSSYNGFNIAQKNAGFGDYIFISKSFNPVRYGVLTQFYCKPDDPTPRFPSDHYPVQVTLE
jgi:endonuclease/exonuclease/phosphatase family metal-dependent hydrolase